jgi:hypothetical protein
MALIKTKYNVGDEGYTAYGTDLIFNTPAAL